eukprot:3354159-Amphidinium_carterae.1
MNVLHPPKAIEHDSRVLLATPRSLLYILYVEKVTMLAPGYSQTPVSQAFGEALVSPMQAARSDEKSHHYEAAKQLACAVIPPVKSTNVQGCVDFAKVVCRWYADNANHCSKQFYVTTNEDCRQNRMDEVLPAPESEGQRVSKRDDVYGLLMVIDDRCLVTHG